MENSKLFSDSVDQLATLVEEGARANKSNISRFIEPAQGTLRRAQSKRHHILFGRRGSGKSSLLFKTAEILSKENYPTVFVDLEPFKGHQYPDIILSVMIATLSRFKLWIYNYQENEKGKKLWYTLWIKRKMPQKEKIKILLSQFDNLIDNLIKQLHLTDDALLVQKIKEATKETDTANIKGDIKVRTPYIDSKLESAIANSIESSHGKEIQEQFKRSKKEYLLKKIIDFQNLFHDINRITGKDCYIFLDDLYHIVRKDQASLLDYIHRIAKGNHVWLKIGTIKNRTSWYQHTPQPIGLKLGDDADNIDLDLSLEKFALSKDFLQSVLKVYIKESNAPLLDELLTTGGIDRLVISSGGVARDFLGLFRRSIDETRERIKRKGVEIRGPKIGAEDVNLASGAYGELKKEEFQRDTLDDRKELEHAFEKVKAFCLEKNKKNIFLVDQDLTGINNDYLQELIDLRLIHQIKSRITVSARPGKIYRAHLLDVSQYTGERMRRDVEMIDFWQDSNKEKLRRALLIYDPNQDLSALRIDIEKEKKLEKIVEKSDPNNIQGTLF